MVSLIIASFIFTTNSCVTVFGPFPQTPPVGVCRDTGERVDLTRCSCETRERCGWYDCDESAKPALHSNEYAHVTGYVAATPPKRGYVAQYEIRWAPVPRAKPPRIFDAVQNVWYEVSVVNGVATLTVSEDQN